MATLKSKFIENLRKHHPGIPESVLIDLISENLICPSVIELPAEIFHQAKDLVQQLYKLRDLGRQNKNLLQDHREIFEPGNAAICMSYDVHYSPQKNKLQLIEVNTNASFLFLSYHLYEAHGLDFTTEQNQYLGRTDLKAMPQQIQKSLLNEKKLWAQKWNSSSEIKKVCIVDENPPQQKLYAEFLVAQSFFKSWGWNTEIRDQEQVTDEFDFIYNRTTDFFLETPKTEKLSKMFTAPTACLSPNPAEYYYLADKQRLIDWSSSRFQEVLLKDPALNQAFKDYVPFCFSMDSKTREEIWAERKKYFFKPKNAYGSKQAYSGDSISRKMLESLAPADFIVQEKIPAAEVQLRTDSGTQNFKYDLRLYAYQGQLQHIVARAYQGQLTNLRTPFGGFAPVRFG